MRQEEKERQEKNEQKFMEEIGAALKRHEQKTKLDEDVLEGWVAAAREKSRARKRRYMAAACCVMVACAGTFSAMNLLSPDAVIAGKNDPVMTEEGNNTIVKEGQGQPGENTGTEKITVNDWEKVSDVKKKYPQLLIPQYVPEGFEFTGLSVEISGQLQMFTYTYLDEEEVCMIRQTIGTEFKIIKDYDRTLETEDGEEIKIKEDINKSGYFMIGESLYMVEGEVSDEDLIQIVNGLER